MAIVLDEPEAAACVNALAASESTLISAGTVVEALLVAGGRGLGKVVEDMIDDLRLEVVPVSLAEARRVAQGYGRWGKGRDPAGLNFGDCFAYAVAKENDCPLLFIGNDFARTDIEPVLASGG